MKQVRGEECAGILAAARTIIWVFLGIAHRRSDEEQARLKPLQIVVAGVLGGAMFVLLLVTLATAIVTHHGVTS